ncbi:MAG: S8 family peptidase [Candidatus Fermentibacteraceae bacterium]|nr:S8 family peptidase [Candidatus Fermentibacteraceae bacterium]
MKILTVLFLITAASFAGVISPALQSAIEGSDQTELHYVLIKPVGSVDTEYIAQATAGMTRDERREFAAAVMKDRAQSAQEGILAQLDTYGGQEVRGIRPLWIVNAIAVNLSGEVIREVALRDDVLFIRLMNTCGALIEPVDIHSADEGSRAVAWGVSKIGAPDVWALGYNGSGVLVSVVDTGVNYNHLDLHNNMWHDTPNGYHYGWDFDDDDPDPMDVHGHGTHCAGSVAGDGTAGTETGVAPGATIMALRVGVTFSDEADVWEAFQFSIDHGADVISTSLGWPQSQSPDRQSWRESEENILAAGICHSIAAGNEGGNPSTPGDIRTPGDCPPPWLHPDQTTTGGLSAVVTVGATDSNDNIAGFSSVGYSTWMYDSPWYDYNDSSPNIGLIDPDISGPGVDIVSCNYSNPSGYTTMSGTSMATPHLAGCMALILSANPSLSPAQVDSLLEVTALDLGSAGKDNIFGSGRVQALEAVQAALEVPVAGGPQVGGASGLILAQAGTNPAYSSVMFDLFTGTPADVEISVYDLTGRVTGTVHSGQLPRGNHSFTWGIPDEMGSGIYFLVASTPDGRAAMRFTVLR